MENIVLVFFEMEKAVYEFLFLIFQHLKLSESFRENGI